MLIIFSERIISEFCQILTATVAAVSLFVNSYLLVRKNKYQFAHNVAVWSDDTTVTIRNGNETAIYNVFLFTDLNTEECSLSTHLDRVIEFQTHHDYYEAFPAKKEISKSFCANSSAGNHHEVPSLLFTDTAGHYWYRKANGRLIALHYDYTELLVKRALLLNHLRA